MTTSVWFLDEQDRTLCAISPSPRRSLFLLAQTATKLHDLRKEVVQFLSCGFTSGLSDSLKAIEPQEVLGECQQTRLRPGAG